MKRRLFSGAFVAALAVSALSASALAAQPANPGCFGTDRAAYIHDIALTDATAPGASEVGAILASRAGDNGTINQAYKVSCGG